MYSSGRSRNTVRSLSMPPRALSHTGGYIHFVARDAVQDAHSVPPLDHVLGKARLVEESHSLANRHVLLAGGLEPVLPAIRVCVPGRLTRESEPVRSLPACDLAEAGSRRCYPIVQNRPTYAAGGLVLPKRPMHVVEQPKRLRHARHEETRGILVREEPADIDVPQIEGRFAVGN